MRLDLPPRPVRLRKEQRTPFQWTDHDPPPMPHQTLCLPLFTQGLLMVRGIYCDDCSDKQIALLVGKVAAPAGTSMKLSSSPVSATAATGPLRAARSLMPSRSGMAQNQRLIGKLALWRRAKQEALLRSARPTR